jgi:hypothetical protein
VQFFCVEVVPNQLVEIVEFLITIQDHIRYTPARHHQLVTCSVDYRLISEQLYNLGTDDILHLCALEHECGPILYESHEGIIGGHNVG